MEHYNRQYLLRNLANSIFSYIFPILLGLAFFRLIKCLEDVIDPDIRLFIMLIGSVPVALLGMIAGAQFTLFLQKRMGKKAERILEKMIALTLGISLIVWYQKVLVPIGAPPLTLRLLWEALLEKFHLNWLL